MAKLELLSRTIYDADGVQTNWDFNFASGYLLPEHVKAFYELASVRTQVTVTPDMLVGPNQLRIVPAVPSGAVLVIYRDTPKNAPLVDFVDRGTVSEVALDTIAKQAVFVAAESADSAATSATDVAVAAAASAQTSALTASVSASSAAASAVSAAGSAASAASATTSAVSAHKAELAASTGSRLIGFLQKGLGAVLRTLEAKLFERASVDDYGADPTGATDSTAAFNEAMTALPANGGNLYMGAGRYLISTLDMPNDPKVINLIGAGKTATTLKMATPQGPIIRKVPTFGRITGALMSDFTIEAHASSDKTNLAHKAMLLTGFNNSFFKRIRYKSNGINPGDGSVGVVFDIASHPYLTYQLVFEGIDCSINHGPSRVFRLNNNGQSVFENPNIIEVRDSWFYALGGCNIIIDGANCTKLKVTGNIFEDCPGATGVVLGQATTVDNNWFELLGTNISTNSLESTDGASSVVFNNYFSGAGTSFIDTISVKPLWIGNAGGGQTITGQGVFKLEAPGNTPAAPGITGGDGSFTLVGATIANPIDITGRVTYLLRYNNTPASAGAKKFSVGAVAGYGVESINVGVIRDATGEPRPVGISAPVNDYWVSYANTDAHAHTVSLTLRKNVS